MAYEKIQLGEDNRSSFRSPKSARDLCALTSRRSPAAKGGDIPLHQGARPRWRPRGLSLQRATGRRRAPGGEPGAARARRGPAAGRRRKEREGRVWFAGNFSGRWVNCDKIGGPSCKNAGEHVAASRSEQSRKRGRARRTNQSLRNPIGECPKGY